MKRDTQIPADVAHIVALAKACTRPEDELIRTWLIAERDTAYPTGSIRRAGGKPIGVDERTRPRYRGAFMHHLMTIDLDDVPQVRQISAFAQARAVAVFISNADDNAAWEAGTDQAAVVALTERDISLGEWSGPEVADPEPRTFDLYPVDVPARAFYDVFAPDFDEDAVESDLADLNDALMSANRIGGSVIHWSGDTYTKDFIAQFGEEVVEANFGDAGTMYVFADTAYFHGH